MRVALAAILAAIAQRDVCGRGQYIDTALLDTTVAMMAVMNLNYLVTGKAQDTGRWGPTWYFGDTLCASLPGSCANHGGNQFLAIANDGVWPFLSLEACRTI